MALSFWKDRRKGMSAYPHALLCKDFASDYLMRKLTNSNSNTIPRGWEGQGTGAGVKNDGYYFTERSGQKS